MTGNTPHERVKLVLDIFDIFTRRFLGLILELLLGDTLAVEVFAL
jgi:hypothetical protein